VFELIAILALSLVVAWGLKGRAGKDILKYMSLTVFFLAVVYIFHEHSYQEGAELLLLATPSKSSAAFFLGYSFVLGCLFRLLLSALNGSEGTPET